MQSKLSKLQKEILIAVYNNHDSIDTSTLFSTFKSYNSANRAMHALVERRLLVYHRKRKYAKEILLTDWGKEIAEEILLIDKACFIIDGKGLKELMTGIIDIKETSWTLISINNNVVFFIVIPWREKLVFETIDSYDSEQRINGTASVLIDSKKLKRYYKYIRTKKHDSYNYLIEIKGTRLIIHEDDKTMSNYYCEFHSELDPSYINNILNLLNITESIPKQGDYGVFKIPVEKDKKEPEIDWSIS